LQEKNMRWTVALLGLAIMLLSRPGWAEDAPGSRLFGSWRLVSFQLRIVGEEGAPRETFGPHPFGRIVFTPDHHMAVFISRPDRKPPTDQTEAAALLSSMTAYTGKFMLDGNKFVTAVDGAWNEIYKDTEQVRYFALDGDMLSIRTPEQTSAILPGKRTVVTLVWERER
jgi:hypothetical protein